VLLASCEFREGLPSQPPLRSRLAVHGELRGVCFFDAYGGLGPAHENRWTTYAYASTGAHPALVPARARQDVSLSIPPMVNITATVVERWERMQYAEPLNGANAGQVACPIRACLRKGVFGVVTRGATGSERHSHFAGQRECAVCDGTCASCGTVTKVRGAHARHA
jgi:hypothetical protein